MKQYYDILRNVLENGQQKQPTRDGVAVENGTICIFGETFRHDMSDGFPLLTTRKLPWKAIRCELEMFIKGITDKRFLTDKGVNFWSAWGSRLHKPNDMTEENWHVYQSMVHDLGPVYGYQWRSFGQPYINNGIAYLHDGVDQLKNIVNTLKTTPYDRRMVCSAWNPQQLKDMALQPCHHVFNIVVIGNKLNLSWSQRSADLLLGVPSNCASYGLLLLLLCKESGLEPGILQGSFADMHIYSNQLDTPELAELLRREAEAPPLPSLNISDGYTDIFNWTWDQATLEGYDPLDKLKFKLTV